MLATYLLKIESEMADRSNPNNNHNMYNTGRGYNQNMQQSQPQYQAYLNLYDQPGSNMADNPVVSQVSSSNNPDVTTNGVCKKFIHGKCRQDSCPYPHDKSKIKACDKYEAQGHCPYGERCNFSHDLRICNDFMRQKCTKGEHCLNRHVYKNCPNFDMGYCHNGGECKLKHVVRKLCWDYMYGYCDKGGRCPDHHPKIFVDQDFAQTMVLFEKLSKNKLDIIICRNCRVIGHKVNKCPKRIQIQPSEVFKCGLCGSTHTYIEDCNYIV